MNSIEYLRNTASSFAYEDGWHWTRKTGIKHIRYSDDYSGYNHPFNRLGRTLKYLVSPRPQWMKDVIDSDVKPLMSWLSWTLAMVRGSLRTEKHLPDGMIKEAGIICSWEEDGEYLELVQPKIGLLLADFLESDPEHPSAKAILAELETILAESNNNGD